MILIAGLIGAVLLFAVYWRYFHIAVPDFPPLSIKEDDPLMAEAIQKAKASLGTFTALLGKPNHQGRVKVPFVSSTHQTEFLWAEVLEFKDSRMKVLYITPPVTHEGRLERVHEHPISDLVDWSVTLPSGNYAGGYSMRVMFVRGREQWGSLPPELESEEKKYQ